MVLPSLVQRREALKKQQPKNISMVDYFCGFGSNEI